jgi:hypothetical protein
MMPLDDRLGVEGERVRGPGARLRPRAAARIQPVLCTFATSHGRTTRRAAHARVPLQPAAVAQGWHDTVDAWNDVLRRVARTRPLLVDLAPLLLGKRVVRRLVHFSKAGHETVARAVVEALRARPTRPLAGEGPR